MKFGKRLRDLLEDSLPEWQDKFLSYKELKKKLKSLPSGDATSPGAGGSPAAGDVAQDAEKDAPVMSEEQFVRLLNEELDKFNTFFMEKEEEFVIRMQVMRDEIEKVKRLCPNRDLSQCLGCGLEVTELRKAIVSLHGEMVLLENYSSLNYTGLVKILKKHDKRTGLLLRYPFISTVLRQPFLTTDLLSKLVKDCEQCIHSMFPAYSSAGSQVDDRGGTGTCSPGVDRESPPSSPDSAQQQQESAADEDIEAVYRSTLTALRSLQEIRGSSKTPHPLLAEAANFPVLSFQRPRDTESKAEFLKPKCSASSTVAGPCVGRNCGGEQPVGSSKAEETRVAAPDAAPDHESHEGGKGRAQEEPVGAESVGEPHGDANAANSYGSGESAGPCTLKRPRTEEPDSPGDPTGPSKVAKALHS